MTVPMPLQEGCEALKASSHRHVRVLSYLCTAMPVGLATLSLCAPAVDHGLGEGSEVEREKRGKERPAAKYHNINERSLFGLAVSAWRQTHW
eukprot:2489938-Amphidinium_carterae.1